MKRTNDFVVMFTLAGLVAIVMIAVLLQSPADRLLILGACGFTLSPSPGSACTSGSGATCRNMRS